MVMLRALITPVQCSDLIKPNVVLVKTLTIVLEHSKMKLHYPRKDYNKFIGNIYGN
tara:strand:- start:460 stop:627 length:168 start_codon:yes stop_codon:yes gene_type:complete